MRQSCCSLSVTVFVLARILHCHATVSLLTVQKHKAFLILSPLQHKSALAMASTVTTLSPLPRLRNETLLAPKQSKFHCPLHTWQFSFLLRIIHNIYIYIYIHTYRIYSHNSRTFLTKILYLNLGCVIYARKRFYVNKSGYTGNFLNIVLKSVNYAMAWITRVNTVCVIYI